MSRYQVSEIMHKQADFVAFLAHEPRTVPELVGLVGAHRSTIRAWLDCFEQRGLARPVGNRRAGRQTMVLWGWAR